MNLGSDFSDDRGFPNWFIAPSLSAFYKLVGPRRVAMAMALILMFQNLVGLGLGPFVTGATIDWAAQHLFAAQHAGGFAALCPGGVDAPDAPGLHTVCRVTLARATRVGLLLTILAEPWAILHFLLAARALRRELQVREG